MDPLTPAVPAGLVSRLVSRLRAAGCVFAEDEAGVLVEAAAGDPGALEALLGRRVAGEPLEQVVGWADFCELRVLLDPGVFVPRQRTALLVEAAVAHLEALGGSAPVVVDVGCGSGALGAAVLARVPGVRLWATDVDRAAVACARRNLPGLPAGRVVGGDLLDPLPAGLRGRVDVLLANGPYVPTADVAALPPEARDHEHRVALDGGVDGLDLQRRVAAVAPTWLAPGGLVLVETSDRQLDASRALLRDAGLGVRTWTDAERGALVVGGQRGRPRSSPTT